MKATNGEQDHGHSDVAGAANGTLERWENGAPRDAAPVAAQRCLVVLGMHRSGTSLLAGILQKLGVDFGRSLLLAKEDNQSGFFEYKAAVGFDEDILSQAGGSWHALIPPRRLEKACKAARRARKHLTQVLRGDFGAASLWGLKDPRLCRVLPVWRKMFGALETEPLPVIVLRHPLESATSLRRRNGFTLRQGCLLWLDYCLAAEAATRRDPARVFLTYQGLLADWRQAAETIRARFDLRWPHSPDEVGAEIDRFVRPDLRHEVAGSDGEDCPPLVLRAFEIFSRLAAGDAAPEGLLRELDDMREIYAGLLEALPAAAADTPAPPQEQTPGETRYEELYLQVFHPRADGVYDEFHSSLHRYYSDLGWRRFEVELPALPAGAEGCRLRLDPVGRPAVVEIGSLVLRSALDDSPLWEAKTAEDFDALTIAGTARRLPHAQGLQIYSFGTDAQVLLPALPLPAEGSPLRLEVWLRATTDEGRLAVLMQPWIDAFASREVEIASPTTVDLQVYFARDEVFVEDGRHFSVEPDRWKQVVIPLPADWKGGHVRLDPGADFSVVDVGGARVRTVAMETEIWKRSGDELAAEARAGGSAQVAPAGPFLRIVCAAPDPQILLPSIDLRGSDEPMQLEISLCVRTKLASLGSTLQNWARELGDVRELRTTHERLVGDLTGEQEAHRQTAKAVTEWQLNERATRAELEGALSQLHAANGESEKLFREVELAHAHGDQRASVLLSEIEMARADGRQQVAALSEQMAAARQAAQAHIDTLTAEIETARADGRQQVAALNEQMAAARTASQAHIGTLTAEIETARADGRQQVAALGEQLATALGTGQAHAEKLTAEIETARAHSDQRAGTLMTEIENLRRHIGELGSRQSKVDGELGGARSEIGTLREQLEHGQNHLLDNEAELRELREDKDRWEQDREFLRQEIAGLHSELQAQDETLVQTSRQQADTHAALAEARLRGEQDHGRVRSMQQSASWKMTLPLRVVSRALTGKRPGGGRNGAASPGAETPMLSAEDMAERNGGYRFQLDLPTDWNLPMQQAQMRGWCLPPAGKGLPKIRVRCGDRTTELTMDVARPDVQAAHGLGPEFNLCGFERKIDLPGGPSQLSVEAVDEQGRAWLVGQYKVRAPYAAWVRHDLVGGNPATDYSAWIDYYDALSADDRRRIRAQARELPYRPVISIVMPVYNTPEHWLTKAIDSVRRQLYPFWELCIADDRSPKGHVREILARYERLDPRIKVCYREQNGHISEASNSALALASGEFVALLDHDDELAIQALYAVALELQDHPEADLIYSDEDKIDEEGKRFSPYFKPQWNPDLLLGQNFISHLGVYRREVITAAGGFRKGYEGCQDWDLALRIVEKIPVERIRHIPRVLYHWRAIEGSTARAVEEKDYIVEASRRVLADHCERTGKETEILPVLGSHFRVRYRLPKKPPLVSVVIPTHNQLRLLRQGIETLRAKTTYPHYEILVVDNRSDDPETLAYLDALQRRNEARVLRYPKPFNYSAINNYAVGEAKGELVCLMNNDMEVITPDWLEEMASQALRPEIGAVGAILYYPDDTIQHAGVVLGLGGVAGHIFNRMPRKTDGYFNRARLVQNFTAVTAACLVVRRESYRKVGGLNETLKVAFNDVEFCLKLHASGLRNLWTPHAEFYHHESASRGSEDTTEKHRRFVSEVEYMQEHWHEIIADDPAYNLNLGTEDGECRLASPPRLPLLRTRALPEPAAAGS